MYLPWSSCSSRASAAARLGQGGKLVFDSLDETVEVLSEALEQPAALCRGFTKNPCSSTGTGTPDCRCVVGLPVAPRVWKGSPTKPNPQPVVYEVKVNYDFYNYVRQNKFYLDSVAQAANVFTGTKIRLPYRTSAPLGPGGGGSGPSAVTSYDAQSCLAKAGPNTNVTPCLIGSIHIKTAWIPVTRELRVFAFIRRVGRLGSGRVPGMAVELIRSRLSASFAARTLRAARKWLKRLFCGSRPARAADPEPVAARRCTSGRSTTLGVRLVTLPLAYRPKRSCAACGVRAQPEPLGRVRGKMSPTPL